MSACISNSEYCSDDVTDNNFRMLLDLRCSSRRRGHVNILCLVPIFITDDPRRESSRERSSMVTSATERAIAQPVAWAWVLKHEALPRHAKRDACATLTRWGWILAWLPFIADCAMRQKFYDDCMGDRPGSPQGAISS
jgi:hypothetical protein